MDNLHFIVPLLGLAGLAVAFITYRRIVLEPGDPSQASTPAPDSGNLQPPNPTLSPGDWQTIAIVGLCVVGPGLLGMWWSARRRPDG